MLRAADDRDAVLDGDRPAPGKDVTDRHATTATDQDVRQIPDRDQAFLPRDLLADQGRVLLVDLGLPVEPPQPRKSRRGVAGLLEPARHDETKHGTHGAARERIADDDLPVPSRIEQVVPVLRRLRRGHDLLGVQKDGRRLVGRKVTIPGAAPARRDGFCPNRSMAIEQRFSRGLRQDQGRSAKPDIGLRVRTLGAHTVVHVLRAHVEPAHIDIGMERFESLHEQRPQISALGTVDDQWRAAIAGACGDEKKKRECEMHWFTEHSAASIPRDS